MDAQIQWDPYGTAEPQHGITSIVMGNDALALAPVLCSNAPWSRRSARYQAD
jgi:N-acyl-D-aspartate/D-glutamate deacylase